VEQQEVQENDVVIIYNNGRFLIKYIKETPLITFCQKIKDALEINQPGFRVVLIDLLKNSRVISEQSLKKDKEYRLQFVRILSDPISEMSARNIASTSSLCIEEQKNQGYNKM